MDQYQLHLLSSSVIHNFFLLGNNLWPNALNIYHCLLMQMGKAHLTSGDASLLLQLLPQFICLHIITMTTQYISDVIITLT